MSVCIDGAYSQLKKIVIKHKSHDQSNLGEVKFDWLVRAVTDVKIPVIATAL